MIEKMRCKGSVFISPGKDLRTFCTRLWVLWARRHPFAGLHQRQQHESNPLFRHPHDICHPQPQSIGSHQPEAATQLPRSRPGHHARETGPPQRALRTIFGNITDRRAQATARGQTCATRRANLCRQGSKGMLPDGRACARTPSAVPRRGAHGEAATFFTSRRLSFKEKCFSL